MTNRWNYAYVSLARHAETGDDRPYLEWHQLEHMPEKYQFAGILCGQRWVSTSACRSARALEEGEWGTVAHVTTYLMSEPIEATLDDFLGERPPAEGNRSAGRRSLPSLPNHFQAPLRLLGSWTAPRINLPPEVLPFRPNRGVYLVVEDSTGESSQEYLARGQDEVVRDLLGVPGVAGACVYGHDNDIRPRPIYSGDRFRVTLYYLDGEPAEVGVRLAASLERQWQTTPNRPHLAAPFATMAQLDLDAFGPGSDG
jgi:hypothetical protein